MKCNHDCLNCIYDDCINDGIYSEKSLYKYRSEEAKQRQKDFQRRKRDEAREKGFCIICRQKPATHGAKCYDCYLRQKRYDKAKYNGDRKRWKEEGLCYFCGKPRVEGKNVCSQHLNIYQKRAEELNNHPNVEKGREYFRKANDEHFRSRKVR